MKLKHLVTNPVSALILAFCAVTLIPTAHADTFVWATWTADTPSTGTTGSATGTMPGFTITYSGQLSGLDNGTSGPSWTPHSTWIGGVVGNGPPSGATSIHMEGGNPGIETITFSGPVANPVLAIWSLGAGGIQTSFDFNSGEPFTIAGGGPNAEYGGSGLVINTAGTGVTGNEGNGLIELLGIYTSFTFTTPIFENYYNFTIGEDDTITSTLPPGGGTTPPTSAVPEPSTLSLLGTGLTALAFARRALTRRR
jgi:PEP-CTERM motif